MSNRAGLTIVFGIGAFAGLIRLSLDPDAQSLAHGSKHNLGVQFVRAFTNDDGVVNSSSRDPFDDGIDPGYDKAVAECIAHIESKTLVSVRLDNGYPSYTCTFWTRVRNTGNRTIRRVMHVVHAPSHITVIPNFTQSCFLLHPGHSRYLSYSVHVEQSADRLAQYDFTVEIKYVKAKWGCW